MIRQSSALASDSGREGTSFFVRKGAASVGRRSLPDEKDCAPPSCRANAGQTGCGLADASGLYLRNAFFGGVIFQLSQAKSGPGLARRAPERTAAASSACFRRGWCAASRALPFCLLRESESAFQEKMSGRYSTAACSPSGSGRTAVPASPAFSRAQLRAVSSASASSGLASFAGVPPLMRM